MQSWGESGITKLDLRLRPATEQRHLSISLPHCRVVRRRHFGWCASIMDLSNMQEYHRQGDEEKKLGLAVSSLTNREKSMGATQVTPHKTAALPQVCIVHKADRAGPGD